MDPSLHTPPTHSQMKVPWGMVCRARTPQPILAVRYSCSRTLGVGEKAMLGGWETACAYVSLCMWVCVCTRVCACVHACLCVQWAAAGAWEGRLQGQGLT